MTKDMMQRLVSLLAECAVDDTVGCVVLTGAGRAFCAGGDVRVQASTAASGVTETPERRTDLLRASMEALAAAARDAEADDRDAKRCRRGCRVIARVGL